MSDIITKVINEFVETWVCYNDHDINKEPASKRINSGDCGLASIAIHYVLLNKFNIKTHLLSNRSHGWLQFNGTDYDTQNPNGYPSLSPANEMWSANGVVDDFHEDRFCDSCDIWMPCDTFGAYLVKAFVERYGLQLPKELNHCIENANKYEGKQGMPFVLSNFNRVKLTLPNLI